MTRAAMRVLAVLAWIPAVLLADRGASLNEQRLLGLATWLLLAVLLVGEDAVTRVQVGVVVLYATLVEYTFAGWLGVYVYRLDAAGHVTSWIDRVPAFVPPGHGLVYLAALVLGRWAFARAHGRLLVAATLAGGGVWTAYGLLLAPRRDALGALWFGCLAAFLWKGRNRMLYVGAFVVVSYLELVGTGLRVWTWAPANPVWAALGQGNPPSGAAGGYGWFDLYAGLGAPAVLRAGSWLGRQRAGRAGRSAASTLSCSSPLVATASGPNGPSSPSTELNRPPASTTIGTSAAMSQIASSGSQAMSTAPSATSMYDQKSPKARLRHTVRFSSRNSWPRPVASQPLSEE
jgi:hypothetical protein